jgi:tripartite tricarboxylate transporter TctB family protein
VISRRGLEAFTAVLTGAFGAAILASSLAIGVGWTPRGLASGAFPAIAGGLIVAGSLYNLLRALGAGRETLIERARLRRSAAMLLPAAVFVAAIPLLGMHVASGIYVFVMVAAARRMPRGRAAAIGIATGVALYAIFDWGFQVTLPRGLLGNALGF